MSPHHRNQPLPYSNGTGSDLYIAMTVTRMEEKQDHHHETVVRRLNRIESKIDTPKKPTGPDINIMPLVIWGILAMMAAAGHVNADVLKALLSGMPR